MWRSVFVCLLSDSIHRFRWRKPRAIPSRYHHYRKEQRFTVSPRSSTGAPYESGKKCRSRGKRKSTKAIDNGRSRRRTRCGTFLGVTNTMPVPSSARFKYARRNNISANDTIHC